MHACMCVCLHGFTSHFRERVTRLFYLLIVDESTVSATVAYSRRADTTVLKTKLTFKKTTTDEEYTVYSKDIKILQRYSNMGLLAVTERVASMDLIKFTNKLVLAWKQHVQGRCPRVKEKHCLLKYQYLLVCE